MHLVLSSNEFENLSHWILIMPYNIALLLYQVLQEFLLWMEPFQSHSLKDLEYSFSLGVSFNQYTL